MNSGHYKSCIATLKNKHPIANGVHSPDLSTRDSLPY